MGWIVILLAIFQFILSWFKTATAAQIEAAKPLLAKAANLAGKFVAACAARGIQPAPDEVMAAEPDEAVLIEQIEERLIKVKAG